MIANPTIVNVEQGTEDWHLVRRGVPTASCFSSIMTATKLDRSATYEKYMYQLAAESVGICEGWAGNDHTERGKELEPEARFYYSFTNDVDLQQVGFVWRNEHKLVGCSPDSLVGLDGGMEAKCASATVHIDRLKKGVLPSEYLGQVYGCLWVTNRKWWDFLSYHPGFQKQLVIRVSVEDEHYQKWLRAWEPEIESFCQRLAVVKGMVSEWCGVEGN